MIPAKEIKLYLPHRHLKNSSSILPVVVAEQCHVRQKQFLHLKVFQHSAFLLFARHCWHGCLLNTHLRQLQRWSALPQELSRHLQHHYKQ